MTERTHSRSAKAELEAQFPIQEQANQNLNWNRKRKEKREGAFVRDARRGGEEQVGGGEHEEGHVEPAPRKDVLLRLEAEAGDLGVGDLRTRVGPGEIRGEAHHGQHGLLLRRVHDRRHLIVPSLRVSRRRRRRRRRLGRTAGDGARLRGFRQSVTQPLNTPVVGLKIDGPW